MKKIVEVRSISHMEIMLVNKTMSNLVALRCHNKEVSLETLEKYFDEIHACFQLYIAK